MELKLDSNDLAKAISNYLVHMGLNITDKNVDLHFTAGRINGTTVMVDITDADKIERCDVAIGVADPKEALEVVNAIKEELEEAVEATEPKDDEPPLETEEAVETPDVDDIFNDSDDSDD